MHTDSLHDMYVYEIMLTGLPGNMGTKVLPTVPEHN